MKDKCEAQKKQIRIILRLIFARAVFDLRIASFGMLNIAIKREIGLRRMCCIVCAAVNVSLCADASPS